MSLKEQIRIMVVDDMATSINQQPELALFLSQEVLIQI